MALSLSHITPSLNIEFSITTIFNVFRQHAGVLDPDCDAEKAAKATATKAVVGVGGRCTPKEALKDTTVDTDKEVLPDKELADKTVYAAMPEKEKKPIKNTTKKIITD